MSFKYFQIVFLSLILFSSCATKQKESKNSPTGKFEQKPNIVILYVDDLGYGDLSCYGATSIHTPNIDALAAGGARFTDAHSPSPVCAPSRYAMMTGRYAFRRKKDGYKRAPGDTDPMMINGTATFPQMLQQAGYKTAVVGKWHLGLGDGKVDWNTKIKPGPAEIGFDYSFLIPVTGDRVPAVFVENQEVVNLDPNDSLKMLFIDSHDEQAGDLNPFPDATAFTHPELVKQKPDYQHSGTIVNGISRIGYMTGGNAARFREEEFPTILTEKAVDFIKENKADPFLLYFAFHDIHVARLPNEQFAGKTPLGPRGDAIVQMDWVCGEIIKTLEELGLSDNTLVILSSDNGPVLYDGYDDQSVELLGDHKPAGPFKGGKYSIYEGANRVPTIASWPGQITPQVNDALWSQTDLFASLAALIGVQLTEKQAIDSENMIDVIMGKTDKGREVLLEEGSGPFALRKGNWKYIPPTDADLDWVMELRNIESGASHQPQLYDLSKDPGEQYNLAGEYPELVAEMDSLILQITIKN